MILLLGGTSETAALAAAVLGTGREVMVSLATGAALELPEDPRLQLRRGRLNDEALSALVRSAGIDAIIDATHPYAVNAQQTARSVASRCAVRYLRYARPAAVIDITDDVEFASDHAAAARMACQPGRTVLLTVGSRNVRVYAEVAQSCGARVVARVLPLQESLLACFDAGLSECDIIAARGPFSVDDTRCAIRACGASVLVSKESGDAGGLPEKLEAARRESCRIVLVSRPEERSADALHTITELIARL